MLGSTRVCIAAGIILTHLLFQILLLRCQLFGLIGQIRHLGTSLLFRHVLQRLIRLSHLVGRRLRVSRGLGVIALAGRSGVAHVALSLLQLPDRLFKLLGLSLA